jgi:NAD(P)-dependent dehydrogenase (short-subunit alcohol dehydrogenase family)
MAWRPSQIPNQHGRTFVVTGANGGLGEVTTRELAASGATVVMACRNIEKAQQISDRIDGDTRVTALDLGDLASVRSFADGQTAFDVLINNAGIMYPPFGRTVDGFEMQFAVNHLGHFALTGLLLDRIGDRVVTLASIAHKQTPRLNIDDLNYQHRRYRRVPAYAQSKLANLMFARELQRRLAAAGSPKRSYAVHPGVSGTDLFANTGTPLDLVSKQVMGLLGHPPQRAAESTLFAATTPDADPTVYWGPTRLGQMRGPVGRSPSRRLSRDQGLWRRLWEESEKMTGVTYDL